MTNLTELAIEGNYLDDRDAKQLASLTGLERLNALGNFIRAAGCKYLTALTRLTALNLRYNRDVNSLGAVMIGGSLQQLRILDLSNCGIGAEGE